MFIILYGKWELGLLILEGRVVCSLKSNKMSHLGKRLKM
jgi:hypothetical protein